MLTYVKESESICLHLETRWQLFPNLCQSECDCSQSKQTVKAVSLQVNRPAIEVVTKRFRLLHSQPLGDQFFTATSYNRLLNVMKSLWLPIYFHFSVTEPKVIATVDHFFRSSTDVTFREVIHSSHQT